MVAKQSFAFIIECECLTHHIGKANTSYAVGILHSEATSFAHCANFIQRSLTAAVPPTTILSSLLSLHYNNGYYPSTASAPKTGSPKSIAEQTFWGEEKQMEQY